MPCAEACPGSVLPDDLVVAGDQLAALRRFLVARKWDLDKAEEQLRNTLAWRTEFGVLSLLARLLRAGCAPSLCLLIAHSKDGRCLTCVRARHQARPPRDRLALVRTLLPSNPHLCFTKAGFPVSMLSLGSADLAASATNLTIADVVRVTLPRRPSALLHAFRKRAPAAHRCTQVADFVVRAEFYRAVVFPEASQRTGAHPLSRRCALEARAACSRLTQHVCAGPQAVLWTKRWCFSTWAALPLASRTSCPFLKPSTPSDPATFQSARCTFWW